MASEGLQSYMDHQQLLLMVTNQISRSTALEEMFSHILKAVADVLAADGVRLVLTGAEGHRRVYATGARADAMGPADSDIVDRVSVNGGQLDSDLLPDGVETSLAVPVIIEDTQYGVLWAGCSLERATDTVAHTMVALLASQTAMVIKYSQDAARKKHEWLSAVLTSTPDPVVVVDRDLHVQLLNPAAQEIFDSLTVGQALDTIEMAADFVEMLRSSNEDDPEIPYEFTAENGRVYALSISDVRTEQGVRTGWVLVLRDISHFKRLHDNMSDFLSTVSHDMRSPLTFMKGYLDMIGMVGDVNEKQLEFIDKIAAGVDQMADMVEKILEAGKLDPVTGTYQLSREASDVVEIVDGAVARLAEPAAKKQLELVHTIADGIPIMNIDKTMLTSAFTNLIENAIKYTPEGGHVEVELSIAEETLLFRVSDDGYGISAEDQEKLFDRNVRVHRKEWKRVKGSGLGLFIVKNVAQRHGGDAWVRSTEGEGSSFYVSIPLDGLNLIGADAAPVTD